MKQWSSSSCLSRASSFKDLLSTTRRHAASAARPRPTEQPEYYFYRPFVLVERIVFSAAYAQTNAEAEKTDFDYKSFLLFNFFKWMITN